MVVEAGPVQTDIPGKHPVTGPQTVQSLLISSMVSFTAAAEVKGPKYLDLSFFICLEKGLLDILPLLSL